MTAVASGPRERPKCGWCGKPGRPSEWEQQSIMSGTWSRLCVRCANRKVGKLNRHPLAGLFITLRRVTP